MPKQRSLAEIGKCPICQKPFIEDVIVNEHQEVIWDGHTYRANCDCMNPNLRFSIG